MRALLPLIAVIAIALLGWAVITPSDSAPAGETATTTAEAATTTTTTAPKTTTVPKPTTTAPKAKSYMSGTNSLNFLVSQKVSMKCSVITKDALRRPGTAYLAGGKARLNFPTTSMVNDGTYIYVWSGTSGVRLLAVSASSGSVAASKGGVEPSAPILEYDCNTATPEAGLFNRPSGVQFVDGGGNPV